VLEQKKLHTFKLDSSPKKIKGFYESGGIHKEISSRFDLMGDAFDESSSSSSFFYCECEGVLYNSNTIEDFMKFEKYQMLKDFLKTQIYESILSGEWLNNPSKLTQFLVLTFANLKEHKFLYWFGFPSMVPEEALMSSAPLKLSASCLFKNNTENVTAEIDSFVMESLRVKIDQYRKDCPSKQRGFFLVIPTISADGKRTINVAPLSDWSKYFNENKESNVYFAFIDPCSLEQHPNLILKNYLIAIGLTTKLRNFFVLCYREAPSKSDISNSFILQIQLPERLVPQNTDDLKCVGWEKNEHGKNLHRVVDVGFMMDPIKLAESSVSLNLSLMKWRMFPALNMELLAKQRCLLLGAGTLGCHVARNLLAWGIFNMTFVDRTKVSFSNPVRQPLFEFEDCIEGGKPKAKCAAEHIMKIYPRANAKHYAIDIPMPGHVVSDETRKEVQRNVEELSKLIQDHDVIFLLTDSRESRWLPTVIGNLHKKLVLTVALGFESFVVMRHGIYCDGNLNKVDRLGCYFCNDVVAPVNSLKDRTLDQQCTVTRPGASAIASALAVELLVSLLHHPSGIHAPASHKDEQVGDKLGLVPHQVRGSLSSFSNMILYGLAYSQCTACSEKVVNSLAKDGYLFLEKVFNDPDHLEDITGLKEMKKSAEKMMEGLITSDDEVVAGDFEVIDDKRK